MTDKVTHMNNINTTTSIHLRGSNDDPNVPQKPFIQVMKHDNCWVVSLGIERNFGITNSVVNMFIYDEAQVEHFMNSLSGAFITYKGEREAVSA